MTAGFNIEDTRLRNIDRIARLTAMVCLALVWAYLVGDHKDVNLKAIKILKHGRRAELLVKYGVEGISNTLMRPMYKPKFDVFNFFHVLNYLSSNLQVLKCSESEPAITSNSPASHTYSSSEL